MAEYDPNVKVVIIEDDMVSADTRSTGEERLARLSQVIAASTGLVRLNKITPYDQSWLAYCMPMSLLQTLVHEDDAQRVMDLDLKLDQVDGVQNASPPVFKRMPKSLNLFWVILGISLIILMFAWVNRK